MTGGMYGFFFSRFTYSLYTPCKIMLNSDSEQARFNVPIALGVFIGGTGMRVIHSAKFRGKSQNQKVDNNRLV